MIASTINSSSVKPSTHDRVLGIGADEHHLSIGIRNAKSQYLGIERADATDRKIDDRQHEASFHGYRPPVRDSGASGSAGTGSKPLPPNG